MIERGPATEDEMIVAFLRAEIDSSRYRDCIQAGVAHLGVNRRLIDAPNLADSTENVLRRRLLYYRGYESRKYLFAGFPSDVDWRRVEVEACDVNRMQYMPDRNWLEISGETRLVSVGARNLSRYSLDQRFQHVIGIAQAI
jgi:hypothetical protein